MLGSLLQAALLATPLVLSGAGVRAEERGADGRYDERQSSHFVLYQDVDIDQASGWRGSRRFEQEVLTVLEEARRDLKARLDLGLRRKVEVVIHDPAIFDKRFAGWFRFPAGGFYGGSIQIRGDVQVTLLLERVLRHELVHAAFDAAAPSYRLPGWLNEGTAEWFEQRGLGKRRLSRTEISWLRAASGDGQLLSLAQLSAPAFGGLAPGQAQLAYLQSYAAVEYLVRRRGEQRFGAFLENVLRLRSPGRALSRAYRMDLGELEKALRAEWR
jgi:hypothetical protein